MLWISPEPAYPSKLLIRSIYSKPFGLAERFSNGFWHIVSIVKERWPPCPAEWLPNNLLSLRNRFRNVNPCLRLFSHFPQTSTARQPHLPTPAAQSWPTRPAATRLRQRRRCRRAQRLCPACLRQSHSPRSATSPASRRFPYTYSTYLQEYGVATRKARLIARYLTDFKSLTVLSVLQMPWKCTCFPASPSLVRGTRHRRSKSRLRS